jgi:hypothetical protein
MDDLSNIIVLMVFAASLLAPSVGYLLAWRSKRAKRRVAGSVVVAVVTGFAGLFMSFWLIGAIMPLPPPDGSPLWESLLFLLIFSPLPLGAFCLSVKFFRRAYREDQRSPVVGGPPL